MRIPIARMLGPVLGALVVWLLAACASSPTGRPQLITVSESEVDRMGTQTYQQMKSQVPMSTDRRAVERVRCVTEAVLLELDSPNAPPEWEVTLFAEDSVNAFALPGGYIGVFEGLLDVAETQDQLAAVIGHEIAHVTARHAAERVSRHQATGFAVNVLGGASGNQQTAALLGMGAQVGLLLPFNRTQESEADTLGLKYMARAGFNPEASVQLWRNMEEASGGKGPPELLSTHPSGERRIEELNERIPEAMELYHDAQEAGRVPDCG